MRTPAILQRLEIGLGDLEGGLVSGRGRRAVRCLILRRLQAGHRIEIGFAPEEGIIEKGRARLVHERRNIAHQGRAQTGVPRLELLDERRIDRHVAYAVSNEVAACGEHVLGVLQIEDVRRDLQAQLVRLVDGGAKRVGGHLRSRAQVVVDANLHEVGTHGLDRIHRGARRRGIRSRDNGSSNEEPRDPDRLLVSNLDADGTVAAQAEHRGDAVARVDGELMSDVLGRIELGTRLESPHVADVPVRVDHPRHDRLARNVDAGRAGRNLDAGGGTDGGDLAVQDDHHAIGDRGGARAVDDARAHEREVGSRRGVLSANGSDRARRGQQAD